jgi:antitoxin ParD1/3/4
LGTNVHLTPALEQFARDAVESGRYNNVSEVVRSGLRMLQDADERREKFDAMIQASIDEADRDGWVTADEVLAEMEAIIAEAEAKQTAAE